MIGGFFMQRNKCIYEASLTKFELIRQAIGKEKKESQYRYEQEIVNSVADVLYGNRKSRK